MKEIIAVIRPTKDRETKDALEKIGCQICTTFRAYGRGKQRGLRYQGKSNNKGVSLPTGVSYLPKKIFYIVVTDPKLRIVIQTIIRVNQTGQPGDGRIFVLNTKETYRIRTKEKGELALK